MTKEYEVLVPFAGYVSVVVKAESEEEAIEKGLQKEFSLTLQSDEGVELEEFEVLESITQGNVSYAPMNDAEASEINQ